MPPRRLAVILSCAMLTGCAGLAERPPAQAPRVPVAQVQQQTLPPPGQVPPPGQAPPPAQATPQPVPQPAPAPPPQTFQQPPPPQGPVPPVAGLPPPRPGGIGQPPPPAGTPQAQPFTPMTAPPAPGAIAGDWSVSEPNGSCRLTLGAQPGARGSAQPQGCASAEMTRVAAWQFRGANLMLLDGNGAPLIMLRPGAGGRYEGSGLSRERYAIAR